MWKDWADHKQTYQELATNHAREKHWVQRTLDRYQPNFTPDITPQPTCIAMDSSGFGDFGLMVCCSPELKKNLYAKVIRSETIEEYRVGLKYLLDRGWKIKAIISDGKGLRQDFYGIPVQMCHFHQQKITTKYLTKKPDSRTEYRVGSTGT